MIRSSLLAALLLTASLHSQTPVAATISPAPEGFARIITLWPDGAPLALRQGADATEGDIPKLWVYPAPGSGVHPAVVVMPGGGYTHVVTEKEGGVEARWLAAHGVSAFVLEYRLSPAYRFPAPMLDGSRAMRYVRAHAAELNIDPHRLGAWGFSAGGHLAGYLATVHTAGDPAAADPVDRVSDRPDFAILSYARLDLSAAVPRPAPTTAAPGMEIVMSASTADLDIIPRVTADTSPSFLYATTGDQTVDSRNATDYYNALKNLHLPVELHIFERGPHGTGMAQTLAPEMHELTIWPLLLANWMQQHDWMPVQP